MKKKLFETEHNGIFMTIEITRLAHCAIVVIT